jgi:type IV pilus assembly protein PilC
MATRFNYTATTKDGKTISGSVETADKATLLALLRKQGVHPVLVEEAKAKSNSLFGPKKKVKLAELVVFTRQLSTMVSAGVPLAKSLAALQGDSENPYFREILGTVTKDVESGQPLSDSFAKYPGVFSDVYVNMVRAGEEGGILDDILKRLATQVELDASIRKKIKGAMMYPVVILCITIIAFFGIMLFIMPKLSSIITQLSGPGTKLPVYTRALLSVSDACSHATIIKHIPLLNNVPVLSSLPNLVLFMILFGIGIFYALRYIKTPAGKYKWHSLLLRLPIFKVIILKIAIARFARTFASLMGAGVSVLDSLQVTGAAVGNKVIEKELLDAAQEVKNGKQLSEPISRSAHFPPIVAQMLLVGEETGQVDTVLVKIADFYEEEVGVTIDSLSALIEPIMIVFMGAGVGLIAASVMGPIANLSKNIGGS